MWRQWDALDEFEQRNDRKLESAHLKDMRRKALAGLQRDLGIQVSLRVGVI